MTNRYYVIGNPIEHSQSPYIHRRFAEQTGQSIHYDRFLAPLGGFTEALATLIDKGMHGANITAPFKQEAFAQCDQVSHRANRAQAVNTLVVDESGRCFGDNTDGVGLLADLTRNHALTLAHRRLLVLGAGGAVRGVLEPLLQENPACLVIANRTLEKARTLACDFADLGAVESCSFDALPRQPFDFIINGTSAGLQGEVPSIPFDSLHRGGISYDMMYASEPTGFVRWGQRAGAARALDGLGMLVEQAAEAFYLWRGQRPDTAAVIAELRG